MSGKVFWDTHLLIYWIEQTAPWFEQVYALVQWQRAHSVKTVTSSLSLAELLVRPVSEGAHELAAHYQKLITQLGCLPFGPAEALCFAEIRSVYPQVNPPDAIQLACAAQAGVDLFLTNDERLARVKVKAIAEIKSLAKWYKSIRGLDFQSPGKTG